MNLNSVKGCAAHLKMLINFLVQWKHFPTDESLEITRYNQNTKTVAITFTTMTTEVSTLCSTLSTDNINNGTEEEKKRLDNNGIKCEIKIVKCNSAHNRGIIHRYLSTKGNYI